MSIDGSSPEQYSMAQEFSIDTVYNISELNPTLITTYFTYGHNGTTGVYTADLTDKTVYNAVINNTSAERYSFSTFDTMLENADTAKLSITVNTKMNKITNIKFVLDTTLTGDQIQKLVGNNNLDESNTTVTVDFTVNEQYEYNTNPTITRPTNTTN